VHVLLPVYAPYMKPWWLYLPQHSCTIGIEQTAPSWRKQVLQSACQTATSAHLVQDLADAEVLAVSIGGLHIPRPGEAHHKLHLRQPQQGRPVQTCAPAVACALADLLLCTSAAPACCCRGVARTERGGQYVLAHRGGGMHLLPVPWLQLAEDGLCGCLALAHELRRRTWKVNSRRGYV
jgi:hypothetical protein